MSRVIAIVLVVAAVLGTLVWLFYPQLPESFFAWGLLIVLGIPLMMFIEGLGERTLASRFFKKRSSTSRVLLAVPLMIAVMFIAFVLILLVQQVIQMVAN